MRENAWKRGTTLESGCYIIMNFRKRKEERLDVGGSMSHRQTQLGGIATIEDAFVQPSLSSMPQVSPRSLGPRTTDKKLRNSISEYQCHEGNEESQTERQDLRTTKDCK